MYNDAHASSHTCHSLLLMIQKHESEYEEPGHHGEGGPSQAIEAVKDHQADGAVDVAEFVVDLDHDPGPGGGCIAGAELQAA